MNAGCSDAYFLLHPIDSDRLSFVDAVAALKRAVERLEQFIGDVVFVHIGQTAGYRFQQKNYQQHESVLRSNRKQH